MVYGAREQSAELGPVLGHALQHHERVVGRELGDYVHGVDAHVRYTLCAFVDPADDVFPEEDIAEGSVTGGCGALSTGSPETFGSLLWYRESTRRESCFLSFCGNALPFMRCFQRRWHEMLSSIAQRTVPCGLCPGCWCEGLHHQRTQTLAG